MATRTISTRLAIEGESEYKQKIANVNRSLKTLGSELALVEAQYKGQANSREALLAKSDVLKRTYEQQAEKVSQTAQALEEARQAQEKYTQQTEQLEKKLSGAKTRLEEMQETNSGSAKAQQAVTAEVKKHQKALDDARRYQDAATRGVEQWSQKNNLAQKDLLGLQSEIDKTSRYLTEATVSADGCAKSIDQYGKEVKGAEEKSGHFGKSSVDAVNGLAEALVAAGLAKTVKEIAAVLWECIEASIEFESAVTGIFKTVDGTPEQLGAITDSVRDMAREIPKTTTEIAKVAETAGQLGIATDDVMDFTRVMLDLGETTNLSAEEGASSLAKFANVTQMAAEDYSRLGSAIVALGNNSATTEADIVAMGTRLAATGNLTGLTQPQIMALSAALSSLGIEAEAGGSAVSKLLKKFEVMVATGSEELGEFAKISGMSVEDFSKAWGEDALGAMSAFLAGLGRVGEQGGSSVALLEELGLTEVRLSNATLALAGSGDLLTSSVDLANRAWEENTALSEEAAKRYATTESQMALLKNSVTEVKAAVGDALSPALREVAESGTEVMGVQAQFIRDNPWLVQVLAGLTAALGVLVVGVTGYTLVAKFAATATGLFSAAMVACPIIPVVAALAALVVGLGAYRAHTRAAAEETEGLSDAALEAKGVFEETAETTKKGTQSTLDMVEALTQAMEAEGKSEAQKASILALVEQLNEAVPGLALAYDQESDSLSMTTQELEKMALAQAKAAEGAAAQSYLSELYVDRARTSRELAEAQGNLAKAEETLAQMGDRVTGSMRDTDIAYITAQADTAKYRKQVEELTAQQEANEDQTDKAEAAYNELSEATQAQTTASVQAQKQSKMTEEQLKEQEKAAKELAGASLELTGAQDTLTKALSEQDTAGSVSLKTALSLIDAGYAAALSFDTETGAVRLNQEAYITAAQAKMDEQIATLEAQRASVEAAIQLGKEAYQATETAVGYLELAKAKRAAKAEANDADLNALKEQKTAYDAQIATLNRAKAAIGSYSYAASSAYKSTSSSAKKAKTQAEKDLETYKSIKAELDHDKDMGLVDEQSYYDELAEIGERYLQDTGNLDALRKNQEEVYKLKQAAAEEEAERQEKDHAAQLDRYEELLDEESALYQERMEDFSQGQVAAIQEIESAYDEVEKKRDDMAGKLSGYGELFEVKDGKMTLENIQDQIDAIDRYEKTLGNLKERGVGGDLLNEILSMDVDDATGFGEKLLGMTDTKLEEYLTTWEEKNDRAKEVAQKFYEGQLSTLESEYETQLQTALDGLDGITFEVGTLMAEELTEGMLSKREEAVAAARAIAEEMEQAVRGAWDIQRVERTVAGAMPASFEPPNPQQAILEQAVKANAAGASKSVPGGAGGSDQPIRLEAVLQLDGRELARGSYEYDRRESSLRGNSLVKGGRL